MSIPYLVMQLRESVVRHALPPDNMNSRKYILLYIYIYIMLFLWQYKWLRISTLPNPYIYRHKLYSKHKIVLLCLYGFQAQTTPPVFRIISLRDCHFSFLFQKNLCFSFNLYFVIKINMEWQKMTKQPGQQFHRKGLFLFL